MELGDPKSGQHVGQVIYNQEKKPKWMSGVWATNGVDVIWCPDSAAVLEPFFLMVFPLSWVFSNNRQRVGVSKRGRIDRAGSGRWIAAERGWMGGERLQRQG